MTSRRTVQDYTFSRPFGLGDEPGLHPAGTYSVTAEDQQIDLLSRVSWRRTATTIELRVGGSVEVHAVDPADLSAAVTRDGNCIVGAPVRLE